MKNIILTILIVNLLIGSMVTLSTAEMFNEDIEKVKTLADKGYPDAQVELGSRYEAGRGGVERDYSKSLKWYLKASEKGDPRGQLAVGRSFLDGYGVEKSDKEAFKWIQKASVYDYALAEYFMGLMHEKGLGISKNIVKAHAWYRLVSEGNPASTYKQEEREAVEKQLTTEQIMEAEKISSEIAAKQKKLLDIYQ